MKIWQQREGSPRQAQGVQPQLPRVPMLSGLCRGDSSQKSPYRHCGKQGQGKEMECLTSSPPWRGDRFSFDIFIISTEICTKSDFFLLFSCRVFFFYPGESISPSWLGKDIDWKGQLGGRRQGGQVRKSHGTAVIMS